MPPPPQNSPLFPYTTLFRSHVLADAVAEVDAQLGVEVEAGAAGRHLGHQLGAALEVAVRVDARLAAALGLAHERAVLTELVGLASPQRDVRPHAHAGGTGPV